MSEERILRDYLNDIAESVEDISDFTAGMTFEEFSADRKTVKAVVRCLEVIGEAANKITPDIRAGYSHVPWEEIVGMRNRLIHEYFGVDVSILWQTIQEDIEPLRLSIQTMARDLE